MQAHKLCGDLASAAATLLRPGLDGGAGIGAAHQMKALPIVGGPAAAGGGRGVVCKKAPSAVSLLILLFV